ncbi:MAG: MFS transporter, partial [Alphaproteobacteria bacterium]|nr:MFS transporter [Alphaproteobacteria bacterium]
MTTQAMTERVSARLPISTKAVYGTGQFVDAVSSGAISTFLLFYLNEVCGLSGALSGASLAIALVVDAFVDPLMGSVSDNTQSRWGRRHPYMIGSLAIVFLGLGLLFSLPDDWSSWPLFIAATGIALFLRLGLSGFIVPYIAQGAELTDDYIERSAIVAWRTFFGVFGSLTPLILGYVVFLKGANIYSHAAYIPFGWVCAGIMTFFATICAFGTLGSRHRLHQNAAPATDHPLRRLMREVVEVFRNRSFRLLFSSVLIFFIAQGTASALALHGGKFFWKLDSVALLLIGVLTLVGVMVGLPLVWLTGARVEKKTMVIWSLAYIVVTQAGLPVAHIAGILPQSAVVLALSINALIVGVAITFLTVGFQSMMADAADEHELLFGARREGLYFAGLSFSTKAASGLGGLISGVALSLIGFPADLASKGGDKAHIALSTINDLGLVYGIVPGAMTTACIVFTILYRIDRKAHAEIQAKLQARRAMPPAQLSDTM